MNFFTCAGACFDTENAWGFGGTAAVGGVKAWSSMLSVLHAPALRFHLPNGAGVGKPGLTLITVTLSHDSPVSAESGRDGRLAEPLSACAAMLQMS